MFSAVPLWLHILAATVWVGSQIMMFAVVVPSLRTVEDALSRYQLLKSLTPRFGWLGFGALALLVATGIDNLSRYSPNDMFEIRYGYILTAKLVMLGLIVAITFVHTFFIGPALLRLQGEALSRPDAVTPAAIASLRLRSIAVSSVTLVLSLGVLFCATLLRAPFAQILV